MPMRKISRRSNLCISIEGIIPPCLEFLLFEADIFIRRTRKNFGGYTIFFHHKDDKKIAEKIIEKSLD